MTGRSLLEDSPLQCNVVVRIKGEGQEKESSSFKKQGEKGRRISEKDRVKENNSPKKTFLMVAYTGESVAQNFPTSKLVTSWRTSCDKPTAPMFLEDSLDSVHNPCVHMLD